MEAVIMLKVERKNEFNFIVTGEGIEAQVWYLDRYDNSVKGKGSRKAKEGILQAVRNFIAAESEAKHQAKQAEIKAKRTEFIKSDLYSNIDLLALYNAELEYYYEQESHWVKYNELMTGYELLNNNDVVNAEKVEIKNTDIYVIPVMSRMAHADERLILINNEIYVTGLTLKEKLLTGLKSYGKIRKANSAEMRMLEELGNTKKTAFLLGVKPNLEKELEMAIRYDKETQRAINATEEPTQPKEFTPDGKEIRYAWFSSKVFNIEEVADKRMASLEKYIVAETITITKEQYKKFLTTFEMSDLGVTFTGGTNSTYEPTEKAEDFYQLSEVEQAKWVAGAYNLALEVKIEGENFSLLIDPQGYSYARYIAIVGDYPTKKGTKNENMSFEFVQTEEVTQEQPQQKEPQANTQAQTETMPNTATKKQRYALYIASGRKIKTNDIIISKEKASELISRSMQGEDITNELQTIVEGIQTETVTGQSETQKELTQAKEVEQKTINSDNSAQEKVQELFSIIPEVHENALDLQFFSSPTNTDDILNLFDTIDLTQEKTLISDEEREYINKLEESYRATLSVFENTLQQLQELYGQYGDYFDVTEETFSFLRGDVHEIEKRIECLKSDFISKICRYFTKKYNITIDIGTIQKKHHTLITAQEIISEIIEQLDGFSFIEKAQQEIKQQLQKETTYIKINVKNNKISLNSFFYIDQFDVQFGKYKLSYNSYDRAIILFKALYLFDSGATNLSEKLNEKVKSLRYGENNNVFTTHELNMKKVKSIKLYKNGRVDIEFTSSHYAREFAKDFLNIVKIA